MTHEEVQSLLMPGSINELDPAAALALEAHVRDCQSCGAWLAQRRSMLHRCALPPFAIGSADSRHTHRGTMGAPATGRRAPAFGAAGTVVRGAGGRAGGGARRLSAWPLWPRAPDLRAELVSASVRAVLRRTRLMCCLQIIIRSSRGCPPSCRFLRRCRNWPPPAMRCWAAGSTTSGRCGSLRWSTSTSSPDQRLCLAAGRYARGRGP